jgi:glycerol uptake facilitator-like aquaporin
MAYDIGHLAGCHLNRATPIGLWAGSHFPTVKDPQRWVETWW